MDAYAQHFSRVISQESDDSMRVIVYPMGTLGSSTDLVELLATNTVQISTIAVGNLGTIVPASQLFLLPYLLPQDPSVARQWLRSSEVVNCTLRRDFAEKSLIPLTYFSEGPVVWTTNRVIRNPSDLRGFKMRVMVSPMLLEAYANFGAAPTPLPFGDVYTALQLNQIDGQVNPVAIAEEMKFYEVTNSFIWAGEMDIFSTVLASGKWIDSLTEEQKAAVHAALVQTDDYISEWAKDQNARKLEEILAEKPSLKLIHLNTHERNAFATLSDVTYAKYAKELGPEGSDFLRDVRREINELGDKGFAPLVGNNNIRTPVSCAQL